MTDTTPETPTSTPDATPTAEQVEADLEREAEHREAVARIAAASSSYGNSGKFHTTALAPQAAE